MFDVFYGNFQALKNVSMNIDENEITAFIDVRVAASPPCKSLNRMNDLTEGCKNKGEVFLTERIYIAILMFMI